MLLDNMLLPIWHINIFGRDIFIPILENICYHQYVTHLERTYLFQYLKIYDIFDKNLDKICFYIVCYFQYDILTYLFTYWKKYDILDKKYMTYFITIWTKYVIRKYVTPHITY